MNFALKYWNIIIMGAFLLAIGLFFVIRDLIAFIEDRRNLSLYISIKEKWSYAEEMANYYKVQGYTENDIDKIEFMSDDEKFRIKMFIKYPNVK